MKKDFKFRTDQYWTPEYNLMPEVVDQLHIPEKVEIHDVTLREGDQTPGCVLRTEEKIAVAKDLQDLGVHSIEIFPIVSQDDFEALKEISSWKNRTIETCALARCITADIDAAAKSGADRVMIEGSCALPTAYTFGITDYDELVKRFVDSIKYAQSLGLKVTCEAWDVGKTTPAQMERFYKEMAATGIDQTVFADTFNNMLPWVVYHYVRKVYEWTENKMAIVPHFHNNFGTALASTLSAVAAGSTAVHCAINGIGEKGGNTPTEELAVALELFMGVDTGVNLEKLYPLCKKVEAISKIPIHRSKPVIGDRIHENGSGLGLDMIDKYSRCEYGIPAILPFVPSLVGAPPLTTAWGKGCGTNMVTIQAKKIGVDITRENAVKVRDMVKDESLLRKSVISEEEVNNLIRAYA
jgi:isopropylmalate/homocitrate/citramalate synthase